MSTHFRLPTTTLVIFVAALALASLATSCAIDNAARAAEEGKAGPVVYSRKTLVVDRHHQNASDANHGTADSPYLTINAAAQQARAGDTVLVKPGIYREWVRPAATGTAEAPVTYVAESKGSVVVKGSEVVTGNWAAVEPKAGLFAIPLSHEVFGDNNPFMTYRATKAPDFVEWVRHYSLGQVFVNGEQYRQVLSIEECKRCPHSWFVDRENQQLIVRFLEDVAPTTMKVELSVRPRIFAPDRRGLGYITVRGFVFEHSANQFPRHFWDTLENAQAGAVGFGSGHHWTLEDCVIRYAGMTGIDCGSETGVELNGQGMPPVHRVGYHVIRNNLIERNGSAGIIGWQHRETQVVNNIIRDNNTLGIMAWETGGIKFHGIYGGVIRDNLISGNETWGIWLDNSYRDTRIEGNLIQNNLWGGIFFEMGSGPAYVVNNIIANSIAGNELHHRGGHAIYGHDAAGVKIYHNLMYANAGFGVTSRIVADRPGGVHAVCQASDWDVRNNLFLGNKLGNVAFTVPTARSEDNHSDFNVFMNGNINPGVGFFAINTVNTPLTPGYGIEGVKQFLMRKTQDANPDEQTQLIVSNWSTMPYLTFTQWNDIFGQDRGSVLLPVDSRTTLRRHLSQFQIAPSVGIYNHRFEKIPDIDEDYFGAPIPEDAVAGPFQPTSSNAEVFHLWPKY